MLKNYELLYIVHPDLEGSTEKINEKVAGFITKVGGEITAHEDWGKRKLAYKIAKNDFGVYVLVNFTAQSDVLNEIERDLRLSEEIMRSMIVFVPDEKPVVPRRQVNKEEKTETTKKVEAPASIIVADETPKPKKAVKKSEKTEEKVEAKTEEKSVEPKPKKAVKKAESTKDDAERLKKIDEKLDELLK